MLFSFESSLRDKVSSGQYERFLDRQSTGFRNCILLAVVENINPVEHVLPGNEH